MKFVCTGCQKVADVDFNLTGKPHNLPGCKGHWQLAEEENQPDTPTTSEEPPDKPS